MMHNFVVPLSRCGRAIADCQQQDSGLCDPAVIGRRGLQGELDTDLDACGRLLADLARA